VEGQVRICRETEAPQTRLKAMRRSSEQPPPGKLPVAVSSSSIDYSHGQGLDGNLRSELEAMHAKWFKAFDSGGRFSLVNSHHQVVERE
jgi:hypothetical protein